MSRPEPIALAIYSSRCCGETLLTDLTQDAIITLMNHSANPICPKHNIPLVRRGSPLSGRLCRICQERCVSERNLSGICVTCQVKLHLQPASAMPRGNELTCPACLGEKTSRRKAAASRLNGKLGGPPMTNNLCRRCGTRRLKAGNKTGVCRTCQRRPRTGKHRVS